MSLTSNEAGGGAVGAREAGDTIGAPEIPPPNLQKWQTEMTAAKMARVPFEREWYQNIAFMFGRQWLQWNAGATSSYMGQLVDIKLPPHRVRLTINLVRRLVNRQYARLTKEQIRGYITPSTSDDEDIAAARAGERLNTYLIDQVKLYDRLNRCDWWTLTCGTGFTKDYYDPYAKVPGPKTEQMNPETGQPEMVASTMYGLPKVETVSPFHLLVGNIDEPDIDDQPWICHVTIKNREDIFHQFRVQVDADAKVSGNSVESKLQAAQGYKADYSKKGVEVYELWVKPCGEYPDGMVFTWTGQQVLQFLPAWPYSHGEYPFTRRQFMETGRFYGESTIVDLRPVQQEYNRTRSQIVEDKNRMARPMMAVQKSSVDINSIKGRPGEIIQYQPGTPPPSAIPMPNIPSYVVDHLKHLQTEMSDIAEQSSLEQSIPAGVTAATAISYVQESQDAVLGETLRDKERAFQRLCRHLLSYVLQYWEAQRQIKVVGQDQNFETYLLQASDLKGNTDWRVQTGSATPQSRAAKQALLMELMKMGILPADKGLQFLDMGDTTRVFEEMQIDVREAERQNLMMGKGEPMPTNDWQNLLVHVTVHDNYRKREEFQNAEEEIHKIFKHHVFMDMFLLAKQMAPEQFDPMANPAIQQAFIDIDPMTGQARPKGMDPMTGQVDPYFVPPQLEEVLRGFIITLQSGGMGAGAPPPGATTQGEPR